MKFSLVSVPIAMLASTVAAQGQYQGQQPQQNQGYQYQQPGQYSYAQQPMQQPQCIGGARPGQYPNIPEYEVADWYNCLSPWLQSVNAGASGSSPGCTLFTCIENTAGKYNRGGLVAVLGQPLKIVCAGGALISNLVCSFRFAL
jgi:hypothetical protein